MPKYLVKACTLLFMVAAAVTAHAGEVMSLLNVAERTYALVGPYGNRTAENLGNNSTSGFVVTDEGVVLIDPGGTWQGAAAIDRQIKQVTDQPVKVVINSGGQDHRWLGNGYFKARGATIIASQAAVKDQKARSRDQLLALSNLVGDEVLKGTEPIYADETFEKTKRFTLGGVTFELHHVGPAHTPGDSLIWLPQQRIVFSGDVVFIGRMLGVTTYSSSHQWIKAFDAMADLGPETIIPGHGPATDLAGARRDTRSYLTFLRDSVASFMSDGGDITQIGTLTQSAFDYLIDAPALKGRNAQQVFQEMEWE